MVKKRICIYGFGSVGNYLHSKLLKSKNTAITIVDKKFIKKKFDDNYIQDKKKKILKVRENLVINDIPKQDIIFITVKSNDIVEIIPKLKEISSKKTLFFLTQNNLELRYLNQKILKYILLKNNMRKDIKKINDFFKDKKIVHCIINSAIKKINENKFKIIYEQKTFFGSKQISINIQKKIYSKIFNSNKMNYLVVNQIENFLWGKLIGIIGSHGLSVIFNKSFKQLYLCNKHKNYMKKIFLEADIIREKLNVKSLMSVEKRMKKVSMVGNHKSSLYYDFKNNIKSELDYNYGIMLDLINFFRIKNSIIKKVTIKLRKLESLGSDKLKKYWKSIKS